MGKRETAIEDLKRVLDAMKEGYSILMNQDKNDVISDEAYSALQGATYGLSRVNVFSYVPDGTDDLTPTLIYLDKKMLDLPHQSSSLLSKSEPAYMYYGIEKVIKILEQIIEYAESGNTDVAGILSRMVAAVDKFNKIRGNSRISKKFIEGIYDEFSALAQDAEPISKGAAATINRGLDLLQAAYNNRKETDGYVENKSLWEAQDIMMLAATTLTKNTSKTAYYLGINSNRMKSLMG